MHCLAVICLSLTVALSLQACPNGWRQSPIDSNKCFLVVMNKKIWFEAGAYCANTASSGFLTSISSAYETYALDAIVIDTPSISSCDQMWIGANDFDQNGQFVWTDNKPFQYTKWGPSQPILSQQCVSSTARTTGNWKTEPCGTENCFICESFISNSGSTTTPTITSPPPPTTTANSNGKTDCLDWLHAGANTDGIYRISPPGIAPFDVYCDMTTSGGGWTVFQRRQDNTTVFWNRLWAEYKNGFNNKLNGNSWLGLDRVNVLSKKDASVTLRIDLHGNRCPVTQTGLGNCSPANTPNGYWYGEWPGFYVDDESNKYRLHVGIISGGNLGTSAQDSFTFYNNGQPQPFSTIDQINANRPDCVIGDGDFMGAWWHDEADCSLTSINGLYVTDLQRRSQGFQYTRLQSPTFDFLVVPVMSEMKLRRNN